ncbi:MAG: hypothetical protein AB4042_07740 [Leptolyngbyaceae cyanobacterium]
MSEAQGPLNNHSASSSRPDFPSIVSADALQRQSFYDPTAEGASGHHPNNNVEALANLVQELNQQNHELLSRISVLDDELAQYRQHLKQTQETPPDAIALNQGEMRNEATDETPQEQVAQLLNHLEFSQQANQRQNIRIESLSMQLEDSQAHIAQLEAENQELQQRYGDRTCRLNQLEEDCRDLRLRLQRQQQYTLQFKAALEKCLEVPPPSYNYLDENSDFTLAPEGMKVEAPPEVDPSPQPQSANPQADEINWFVQPLFPKVQQIQSWAKGQGEEGQTSPQTLLNPTDDPKPEGETSAQASEQPYPLLPQERLHHGGTPNHLGHRSTRTPAVFQNFPKPRFQSTLLNLAYGKVTSPPLGHQSLAMPNFGSADSALSGEATSTETTVGETTSDETMLEPFPSPTLSLQDMTTAEDGTQNTVSLAEETSKNQDAGVANFERQEKSEKGEGAIPIPSTVSDQVLDQMPPLAPELQGLDAADTTDEKLWQSLVDLIDLSAADGLNLPAKAGTEVEAKRSSAKSSTDVPVGSLQLDDDQDDWAEVGVTEAQAQVLSREIPQVVTTDDSSPSPSSPTSTPETQALTQPQRISRRSIDLPSFPRIAVPDASRSSNSTGT